MLARVAQRLTALLLPDLPEVLDICCGPREDEAPDPPLGHRKHSPEEER